jgi:hypothetical protein
VVSLDELKEKYGPAAKRWAAPSAFVGGFLFDIVTLGREVNTINLIVLSVYAGVVYLGLWLRNQNVADKWKRVITFVLHFALGAVFSALVVLYFKSAGSFATFLVVAALFTAQVANEFLQHRSNQRELIWAIYTISLVMLLNFMLPHLIGSVSVIWFLVSCVVGLAAIWGLRHLVSAPITAVRTATALTGTLVVFYFAGWIPPVPLILENGLEGVNLKKVRTDNGREYTIDKEPDSILESIGLTTRDIAWRKGERVYVATAISAPSGVTVELQHRWYQYTDDGWKERDVHDFTITGGRKKGFRWYSYKSYLKDGQRWRIVTAQKNGGVLGYQTFDVVEVTDDEYPVKVREAL